MVILTSKPIYENFKKAAIQAIKNPNQFIYRFKMHKNNYGHKAVTQSLLQGLKKAHTKYCFNPIISSSIKGNVLVLSGVEVLDYVISIKSENNINSLSAGPNIVVHADENECILGSASVDKVIVPSDWVKHAYEKECKETLNKIVIWPSGTDIDFWKPTSSIKKNILVYMKTKNIKALKIERDIKHFFKNKFDIHTLKYGNYTTQEYKTLLDKSFLMIYFTETESQGLALQESWAMGVPTFVWESGCLRIGDKKYDYTSPAPYLNKYNGKMFKDTRELKSYILEFDEKNYDSRKWVVKNMTTEKSAKKLLISLYE
jgi:hypothetical protein